MATPNKTQAAANPAPVQASAANAVDTSAWIDLPIGFDPYWSPEVGKKFVGRVCEVDARDPHFIRLRYIAGEDTWCAQGDVEHAQPILVPKGGFFTTSVYAGMEKEMVYHLQSGVAPMCEISVIDKGKVKTGPWAGKDFWRFKARTSVADQKLLAEGREAYFRKLAAGGTPTRPAIDTTATATS